MVVGMVVSQSLRERLIPNRGRVYGTPKEARNDYLQLGCLGPISSGTSALNRKPTLSAANSCKMV